MYFCSSNYNKRHYQFLNIKGDLLSKKHLLSEFIKPIKKGAYHELECLVR